MVSGLGSVCMSCSFVALSSEIQATDRPCGKGNSLTGEKYTSTTDCKGGWFFLIKKQKRLLLKLTLWVIFVQNP